MEVYPLEDMTQFKLLWVESNGKLGALLSMIERNRTWARILENKMADIRQTDPDALFIVYAGQGHTSWLMPYSLPKFFANEHPAVVELSLDGPQTFTSLFTVWGKDDPFFDFLSTPALYYWTGADKRALARNSGFDYNLVIPSRTWEAVKRIYKTELNLGALEYANSVSRSICTGESVRKINYTYPAWLLYTATMLATGSFCIYFGGSFTDALFSGLIGIIIGLLPVQRLGLNLFSKTLVESTVSGFFAFLPAAFGIPSSPDKIMTGTIMLLIPGMSVGNAMKDMMSGDLIAGILEITEALVTALAIVLGFAAALIVFGRYNYG